MDPNSNNNSYSNTSTACVTTCIAAVDEEKVNTGSGNSTTSSSCSNKEEASSSEKLTQQFVDWVDKQNHSSSPSSSSSSVDSELLDGVSLNSEELKVASKLLNNNTKGDEASSMEYSLILVATTSSNITTTMNEDEIQVDSSVDCYTSILYQSHNGNPTRDCAEEEEEEENEESPDEASTRMPTHESHVFEEGTNKEEDTIQQPLEEHEKDNGYFSCKDFSPLHPEEALLETNPTTATTNTSKNSKQGASTSSNNIPDSSWHGHEKEEDDSSADEESFGGRDDEEQPKTTANKNGTIAKTTTTTRKKKKPMDVPRNTNNRRSHTTSNPNTNASSAVLLEPNEYIRSSSSRISFGDTVTTAVASRAKLVLPLTRSTDVPNRDQWTYTSRSRQRIPYSQNLHPPVLLKSELAPQKRPRVLTTFDTTPLLSEMTTCFYNRKTCKIVHPPTNMKPHDIGEILAGYAELEPCFGEKTVGRTSSNVCVFSGIRPQNSICRCSDAHVGCIVEVTSDGLHKGKQGIIKTALSHIGWYIISLLSNNETEDIYIKATNLKSVENGSYSDTSYDDLNVSSLRGMDPSVLSQF